MIFQKSNDQCNDKQCVYSIQYSFQAFSLLKSHKISQYINIIQFAQIFSKQKKIILRLNQRNASLTEGKY